MARFHPIRVAVLARGFWFLILASSIPWSAATAQPREATLAFFSLLSDQVVVTDRLGRPIEAFAVSQCCVRQILAADFVGGDGVDEFMLLTEPLLFGSSTLELFDVTGHFLDSLDLSTSGTLLAGNLLSGTPEDELVRVHGGSVEIYDAAGNALSSFEVPGDIIGLATGDLIDDGTDELLVAKDGGVVEVWNSAGVLQASIDIGFDDGDRLGAGDIDGDGKDEIVQAMEGEVFWRVYELDGTLLANILEGHLSRGPLFVSDMDGDGDADIILASGSLLTVYDGASSGILFSVPAAAGFSVGEHPYPDADADGLLDSWEQGPVVVGGETLDLAALDADPMHKDLYLEIDWMSDGDLRETGWNTPDRPYGGTCSDGVDNDGDGIIDLDDEDCYDPRFMREGTPAFDQGGAWLSCRDGEDNDGDGVKDEDDTDCRNPQADEAGVNSCSDGFDNDGDGLVDVGDAFARADFDCLRAPTQTAVREVKKAFCIAPLDAGGYRNPDGRAGIDLHVTTGPLADPNGSETGILPCTCGDGLDNDLDGGIDDQDDDCLFFDRRRSESGGPRDDSCNDGIDNDVDGATDAADPDCIVHDPSMAETSIGVGTCRDGIDNDGDGFIDIANPIGSPLTADLDCLVGDHLSSPVVGFGGDQLPTEAIDDLDDGDFYELKRDHFASPYHLAFRYAISAKPTSDSPGGQAEIGGNDFIDFNRDGGTLMHEFGHTLNLRHGGDENDNCKPNYVSVMNYTQAFGIFQRTGNEILDYSPPRFLGGRGTAPLPSLSERDLDESFIMDPTDPFNFFVYSSSIARLTFLWPLDGDNESPTLGIGTDWSGNGSTGDGAGLESDIDAGIPCFPNGISDDLVTGHDDWSNLLLPFRGSGDSEDGPINPLRTGLPFPRVSEFLDTRAEQRTADLAITKLADPDPVEVGDPFVYRITVTNTGPGPAARVEVVDALPPEVDLIDESHDCEARGSARACELGQMLIGNVRNLAITVGTENVCENGIPATLVNSVSVENTDSFSASDPSPDDNRFELSTTPVDTTAPSIECNAADSIRPREAPISFTATASDACDDAVVARVVEFDCFRFSKKDRRIDKTESCIASFEGDTIHIVDSGGVDDRIVWTVESSDRAGNVRRVECGVDVVR